MKAYTVYKKKEIAITNPDNNQEVEHVSVEYREDYEPEIWTYSNGDPGHPSNFEREMCGWTTLNNDTVAWITENLVEKNFYEAIC